MKRQESARSRLLLLCACVAILGGCASATTTEGMVPTDFVPAKKFSQTVSVAVSGGKETDAIGKPQITDAAFAQALADAITKSQTFSRVVEGKGGSYLLTVVLSDMEQPSFGASFTVTMEAGWTLRQADSGKVVWQESIRSEGTATMSDAVVAATRLRLATEFAAKNNISQGLGKVSQLNL